MFKRIRKPFLAILSLQLTLGFLHLVFFDLGHPLSKYITTLPLALQVLAVSVYALVVYIIAGYLVMVALNKNSDAMQGIGRVLFLLFILFLTVFLSVFALYLYNERQSLWLIYSVVNPLFGTAMYNRVPEALIGLVWSVSSVVPGIGVLIGMIFGVRKGEIQE